MSARRSPSAPSRGPVLAALLTLPLFVGCAAASGGSAFGPDRPGVTPGPDLTPAGRWVTEVGYGLLLEEGHHHQVVGQGVLRTGLTDGLELRLGPGSVVTAASVAGEPAERTDVTVGLKGRLSRGGGVVPSAALTVLLRGEGGGTTGLGLLRPSGVLATRWSVPAGLDLVGSWEIHSTSGAPGGRVLVAGASLERGLSGAWGLALGWSTSTPEERAGRAGHGLDLSLAWSPLPDLQLDVGGSVGIGGAAGARTVAVGLARRW